MTNQNQLWIDDDSYFKNNLCHYHFSDENVYEGDCKLRTYKVQVNLLNILNDEGACPKIFDIVMEWVNEYFEIKEHVRSLQRFRTQDSIANNLIKTYSDITGGSIETKQMTVNDVSCLAH